MKQALFPFFSFFSGGAGIAFIWLKISHGVLFILDRVAWWTGALYLYRKGKKTHRPAYIAGAVLVYIGSWALVFLGSAGLIHWVLKIWRTV
jgi:hypothetical protein